ncbi:hypothetical protein [Methylotuvimicrobium sp. KM2]|uniref:hypothetical protein n=1 Tax=Methylotuvimicrobium sp. KM2 TaxID=3133976 RepID=UPI003100A970
MPELLIAMQSDYRLFGNKAQSVQHCLDVWNRFRDASGYCEISLVKAAMGDRIDGFPIHVRAPLMSVPTEAIDPIRKVICQCRENFRQLLAA